MIGEPSPIAARGGRSVAPSEAEGGGSRAATGAVRSSNGDRLRGSSTHLTAKQIGNIRVADPFHIIINHHSTSIYLLD